MLNLDETEYDLNTLFSFEVLKEILLKLARSQTKIEKEINQIKNKDLKRIERIVQDSLGPIEATEENNEDENENENDLIQNEKDENENELDDNKNKSNTKEIITDKNKNKDNDAGNKNLDFPENENYNENLNNDKNNLTINNNNHENINEVINDKSNEMANENNNENDNKEINEQNNEANNGNVQNAISNEKNMNYINNKSSKNPPKRKGDASEELSKLMKLLNAQNKRISALEDKLKLESKNIKNAETKLKNHSINNDSQFNLINEKINELFHNNKDYDKKIEDLQVKTSDFDIFSMFKDSGDGTIDATKVMVKALEEKVFKKFEIQDKRYKIESLDNMKTKNNVENIMPQIDQIHREIERIREIGNQQQEELDNNKRENNEQNYEIKNVIINELKQKMNQLNEELEKRINNKLLSLEQKMKNSSSNNQDNNFDLLKLNLGNDINQETIDTLDKKINDLRKKLNDLDNTFRLYMNKMEIEPLKNELKDLKLILENKITKDDLKELYNFHLNTVDEINDLKDFEEKSYDELKKNIKELKSLQQRIEILNGNVALLQNSPKKGGGPMIDLSKFVDHQKLTETLKPFLNQLEKIYREIDSIRRDMSLIEEDNIKMIRNAINNLDSEVNNRINELKNYDQKKYVDKTEFNKAIRLLEVEIVELKDDNKKDADTWLLAKKPLKCFNCATCEANIKNEYSSADYLPWKKYPRGEKIHRMGEGFSHMLHMMTSEFVKSIEKNELSQDYNFSSRNSNTNNNINTQLNEKSTGALIINNKEQFNEKGGLTLNNKELFREEFAKNLKKFSKMRLPKVRQYSNTKTIFKVDDNLPVSEDEINYNETVTNENRSKLNHSPKILKISKKQKSTFLGKDLNDIYGNIMSSKGLPIKRDFDFNKKIIKTEKSSLDANGNNFKN